MTYLCLYIRKNQILEKCKMLNFENNLFLENNQKCKKVIFNKLLKKHN
jgi:hypothetical protein